MHTTHAFKSKKITITVNALPKVRGARILGRNAIFGDRRTKRRRTRGNQNRNAIEGD